MTDNIIVQVTAKRQGQPAVIAGTILDPQDMPSLVLLDHWEETVGGLTHEVAERLGLTPRFRPLGAKPLGKQAHDELARHREARNG